MKKLRQMFATPTALRKLMNCYPPYLGAGIQVTHISDDYRIIDVQMKLRWYNRNYVGTHFGGSLFAMTDPFYMLALMNILGNQYLVWDKGADIDFIKPGAGTVFVKFEVTESMLQDIYQHTDSGDKYIPTYPVTIIDEQGETVAKVNKRIYIRRKPNAR